MTVLIFIAVLGLLIFVHELGHFVTARRNGVACHEFGFGFPPRAIGVVKDDDGKWKTVKRGDSAQYTNTIFSLNWIPLGGFVRIKGEDGEDKSAESFATKSAWVRFKILVAGVVMNVILAWALFAFAGFVGMEQPMDTPRDTGVEIVTVIDGAAGATMGVQVGDAVQRVCAGDECIAITTTTQFQEVISAHKGQEITMSGMRGDTLFEVNGALPSEVIAGQGTLGVQLAVPTELVSYGMIDSIVYGAQKTWDSLGMIFVGLGNLVGGFIGGDGVNGDVAGPVGIAVMTGEVANKGIAYLAFFAAILSANLAVINILPIPALDGGRIVFIILEVLRGGRPMNKNVEGWMHGISFMLLILLMVVVTVFDVMRYF